jgi:hypothetical protein
MRTKTLLVPVVLVFLALPGIALAELDAVGNIIDSEVGALPFAPGDPCGFCASPGIEDFGVTFKNGELWVVNQGGTLYHLQGCLAVESISIRVLPAGLGYDSSRGLFIVTDASVDVVHQIDLSGTIVNTWPSPADGPVGAAYDPTRDLYWISDYLGNAITSMNPNTGLPGPTLPVPAGTRIAGTGYDATRDAILYNGRDQGMTYWMSAANGSLLGAFPNPGGPGLNNGQGAGIALDGNGWVSHYEQPAMYCLEGFGPVAVEDASWGRIKAEYR